MPKRIIHGGTAVAIGILTIVGGIATGQPVFVIIGILAIILGAMIS